MMRDRRLSGSASQPIVLLAAVIALVVAGAVGIRILTRETLPDFRSITELESRKAAFAAYLIPHLAEANAAVLEERQGLDKFEARLVHGHLERNERRRLERLAERYGMQDIGADAPDRQVIAALRLRVDVIPPSLALAQAAWESGWGTSRFAREGNNLFGLRCHRTGCGIPASDNGGPVYRMARFRTPAACFATYLLTLNSNPAYEPLWVLRQQQRRAGEPLSGQVLAGGLGRYSADGPAYVEKLQAFIRDHQLELYDAAAAGN